MSSLPDIFENPKTKGSDVKKDNASFKVVAFFPNGEHINKTITIPSLMKDYDLHVRDILAIHPSSSSTAPCILPRKKAILVQLDTLRAIITSNSMLFFDVGSSITKKVTDKILDYYKEENERYGNTFPFELSSLEGLLVIASSTFESRLDSYKVMADQLVVEADTEYYHDLHSVRSRLSQLDTLSSEIARCIQEMLDNDEDMLELLLTEKEKTGHLPPHDMHLPVELLLESYYRKFIDISNETRSHLQNVVNTQDMATINLDNKRNKLLSVNLKLSIAQLALSTGSLFGAVFGMNLINGFEASPYAFWFVSGAIGMTALSIYYITIFKVNFSSKRNSKFDIDMKFVQNIFKDVNNIELSYLEWMDNNSIYATEKVTANEFIHITEDIIQRELTAEEVHNLLTIVKADKQGYISKYDITSNISRYFPKK
ncbi:hypothetical protein WA158_005054 [Blastocystis sp. Blastoise]